MKSLLCIINEKETEGVIQSVLLKLQPTYAEQEKGGDDRGKNNG